MVACKKKDEVAPKTAGKFGLTQMHANQRVRKQVIDGVTYVPYETAKNQRTTEVANFDLGNLKASKSFYFILSNNGDRAITDVTIESNNPQFEIFPKSIDKLAGASEDGIVPLLELGVIHGNRLNGIGFQSLLPMGDNTVEVTIKGKTQGENGEETVELKAEVKLFAQVMDIKLFKANNEVDLNKVSYSMPVVEQLNGLGRIRGYSVGNSIVTIENSGNVNITLEIQPTNTDEGDPIITHTLSVGAKLELGVMSKNKVFALEGGGATTDYKRIAIGDDGKGYFAVSNIF
ncbi:hypothetical protein M23134_03993 [Microscilla marina ATCC 23134]|uniref:Uncharacterized protein n=2 Tax=Microscilla marina TaxID=1027 RepID=A1ZMQ0_MICM2|nr:hypothetical protein M23134_03993 [Microscilla marina ATCC 23134]